MTTFAFIGEGVTDFCVVENILLGWFGDQELEPEIIPLQPPALVQGGATPPGGWTLIKAYLAEHALSGALGFDNDYVVIHIDSDVCEEPGFGVKKQHPTDARPRTPAELVTAVRNRVIEWIGVDKFKRYEARVLFAIAVEGIECWLLPLLTDHKTKQAKTTNCLKAANDLLRSKDDPGLAKPTGHKNLSAYRKVSKRFCKLKTLRSLASRNPSLNLFVQQLEARAIVLVDDWS